MVYGHPFTCYKLYKQFLDPYPYDRKHWITGVFTNQSFQVVGGVTDRTGDFHQQKQISAHLFFFCGPRLVGQLGSVLPILFSVT
jgi:hypothetical protein